MIVQKNGERFTVDTTNKEIDVILYFPKLSAKTGSDTEELEKIKSDLINSNQINDLSTICQVIRWESEDELKTALKGSMTDKGKELIDKAIEVQLQKALQSSDFQNLGTIKMSEGEVKTQLKECFLNYNSTRHKSQNGEAHWSKSPSIVDFREDRLSEANQQNQREQEVISQWESKKEIFPNVIWNDEKKKGIKKAIHDYKYATPKSVEELLSNMSAYDSATGFKETAGKTDYSEINLGILDLMAERFQANKVKYPKGNTKKSLDKQDIIWALFRHVKKMVHPIEGDEETFKDHLAAVLTNCSIILDQLELEK